MTSSAAAAPEVVLPRVRPVGFSGRAACVGGAVVAVVSVVAVLAPLLAPWRPTALAGRPLQAPSWAHPLGTNGVGQDLWSQLLSGARVSLLIAILAGLGTLVVGALVGLVAGWVGGRADAALMRVTDLVLAIPRLPLLIVVGAYLGPTLVNISAVIALTFWPAGARVVRSQVLSLRRRAHLTAAIGFGATTWQALRRHIIPEVGLILAAGLVASAERAVMLEAGLAFLGLGDATRTSWGAIMRDALDFRALFYTQAWMWWLVPPVVALTLLLLGITFLGIGLEERINPRLSRHPGRVR